MKRALIILLLIGGTQLKAGDAGEFHAPTPMLAEYHFAVNLQPSANNARYTCAIVKVYEDKIIGTKFISSNQFVLQATGMVKSEANPTGENLIEKFEIDACIAFIDTIAGDYIVDCDPVSSLWKLRYEKDPTLTTSDPGYSNMPLRPSDGQMGMLSNYGIRHITHFTYGEKAFQLIHDLSDPTWVSQYKSL